MRTVLPVVVEDCQEATTTITTATATTAKRKTRVSFRGPLSGRAVSFDVEEDEEEGKLVVL
jgi:hypothetical protein